MPRKPKRGCAAEYPLCERCLEEGKITPVEEVHHKLRQNFDGKIIQKDLTKKIKEKEKR